VPKIYNKKKFNFQFYFILIILEGENVLPFVKPLYDRAMPLSSPALFREVVVKFLLDT
jgi:hypothetical protein